MKSWRGFTVLELLVVIAVIGILAAITTIGFSQYQATTRDAQRESKATVIAEALEKYYEKHGEYPGCADLTDSASSVTGSGGALETVNLATLVTPQAADGIDNSIECSDLTSLSDDDIFAYVGDGSGTCTSGTSCLEFTLKYKDEQSGQILTIQSRHTTDIATSGDTTLTGSSISSSQIDLTWDAIPNASSYELVRATNAGFTTGVDTSSQPTNSASITTGLSPGTQYWFHVRAISAGGNSAWSNDFNTYTRPAAPTGTVATTASSSQVNVSWNAVAGATSYRVQRSTTSNFAGGTTGSVSGIAGSPYSYGSLQQGTQYWFRVYASNGGGEGTASNIDDAITTLPAPTGLVATPTANSINFSWGSVTNATSYDVEYSTSPGFSPITGSYNNLTGTSQNITGLSTGVTYYLRVYAENATTTSAAASTSATTTVPAPSTPTIAWTNDLGSTSTGAVTCSLGSPQYSRATTYRTDGSTADNFGAWSAWQAGTSFTTNFITGEGMYGKAKVRAKCVYSGTDSAFVESAVIDKKRPITTISASTWYNQTTASARVGVGGSCASGTTSMYKWGQIYHGSAGYKTGGGWGQWGDFELVNTGWSMNDSLNVYRISRTICQTPYWETSLRSNVAGATLQNCCGATALTNYNNFVNAGYNYSVAR